jgi:pentose-5-phosphate-3-epimerase
LVCLVGSEMCIRDRVSIDNAEILKEAGADRLVAGSAIFQTENVFEAYEELKGV